MKAAVKIQVDVLWVVTPCSVAVGYSIPVSMPLFPAPSTLQWSWGRQGLPKHWYPTTTLHGVTSWSWRQHGPPKR